MEQLVVAVVPVVVVPVVVVVVVVVLVGLCLECPADGDCKSGLICASPAFVIEMVITT